MASTRPASTDPIRDFKFSVEISAGDNSRLRTLTNGIFNMGFAVVTGLSVTNEVIQYREGGMNTHPHKMVGQSDYGPVTFSRGVFYNSDQLYKWQQFMHTWNSGQVNGTLSESDHNDYRCKIGVRVLDHPATGSAYVSDPGVFSNDTNPLALPEMRIGFVLYNCWPGAFSMTDLNASSSAGILVQQMTIHHEGFVLVNNKDEYEAAMKA